MNQNSISLPISPKKHLFGNNQVSSPSAIGPDDEAVLLNQQSSSKAKQEIHQKSIDQKQQENQQPG